MRVLQITAFSGWGCTGRIALGIHNALVSLGHESAIAWGRVNTAPDDVTTFRIGSSIDQKMHGLYTRLTDKCGFASKNATRDFIKQIELYEPDLVQLHIMHGYYINIEMLFRYLDEKGIPVVWTFHDCWAFTGHCPYFDMAGCDKWKTGCHDCGQRKKHPASWLMDNSSWNWEKKKALFTGVNNLTIVTPSKWLAGLVGQSFFRGFQVEVIHNGINLDSFKPKRGGIRHRLGLDAKTVILGVSSTWAESKGLADFELLADSLPETYKIVLVGLTKMQTKKLSPKIVGVGWTDSIDKLAAFYSEADLFLNLTYEDNFPTTNIEALACGTPVVTYNTGGSIEAAGNTSGKIIEKGDIASVADYIVSGLWKKISAADCRSRAMRFDEKERFMEYVMLYEGKYSNGGV